MFKELEEFQKKARQTHDRLNVFKADLQDKRNEYARQQQLYQRMLDEEVSGDVEHGIEELNAATRRLADLEKEIEIAELRVKKVESGAAEQLEPLLRGIRRGADQACSELNAKLLPLFDEVRSHRAQMLLMLQRASSIYSKLFTVSEEVYHAEQAAGVQHTYRSRAIDIRSVLNDERQTEENEEKIGILPNAFEFMEAAHQGKVPQWVERYSKT